MAVAELAAAAGRGTVGAASWGAVWAGDRAVAGLQGTSMLGDNVLKELAVAQLSAGLEGGYDGLHLGAVGL